MLEADEFRRLLDFVQEPLFIVRRSGRIETANGSARAVLGNGLVGRHLSEFTVTAPEVVDAYLRRCAGSGSPVVAAIVLRDAGGKEVRFQVKGALLSQQPEEQGDRIVLRCSATAFREFTRLSREVEVLNEDNRRQRHSRAVLRETLAQRDLLLREVQHRVRNQTQTMLSMVSAEQRKAKGEELSVFLDRLRRRLLAMGTVQQLMYTSSRIEDLSARQLLTDLCNSIRQTWPPGAELTCDSIDADLNNEVAVPLAIIINELLSNALKHGLKYGAGAAKIDLSEDQDELVLTVWDCGPGLVSGHETSSSSSGLALVRGMCRQIGGSFAITYGNGTSCSVRFPRSATAKKT